MEMIVVVASLASSGWRSVPVNCGPKYWWTWPTGRGFPSLSTFNKPATDTLPRLQTRCPMQQEKPGTPASATEDRRKNRLTVPACAICGSTSTRVACRVEYALYVRCDDCGHVWGIARPGEVLPGEP